jgi:anhydro-N-acetylmuramic acid kinase
VSGARDSRAELFIGMMSGTSLDGVDGVLADFSSGFAVLAHAHRRFAPELRTELAALTVSGTDEIERSARAALALADVYADCVSALLASAVVRASDVRAIGAHGQTVRHRPGAGFTIQLNAPARLAERCGIDVIADFRSRDVAAGGQGAPLAPAFHAAAFTAARPRAVLNLGGISNVTRVAGGEATLGFDCGPGNALLDLHAMRTLGAAFDADGALAARGTVDTDLLTRLRSDPYFAQPPPKSTGREHFSSAWLDRALAGSRSAPADVQRSLTEFTARCVGDAIAAWCPDVADVVACGGGVRNATLMAAIAAAVAPRPLTTSDTLGVPHDQVEALAFAWLARRFIERAPGASPAVTGARGPRVLGALYPR